jgi:hypothetical protein
MTYPDGIPKITKDEKVAAITKYELAVERSNTFLRKGIR